MRLRSLSVLIFGLLISPGVKSEDITSPQSVGDTSARTFAAKGVVREVNSGALTVVIQHEAISNYMDAMTMPFKVLELSALAGLSPGDEVSFQLHVTAATSWVGQIKRIGSGAPGAASARNLSPPTRAGAAVGPSPPNYEPATPLTVAAANPLLYYKFTNELGQAVSLNDFHGRALGVTFFYTRCPLPDYCPRLSKNFQEASEKLAAMTNAPANWHFISITFDPAIDTPAMLLAYGTSYHYDPNHWSFLTGPPDKIAELAKACGVEYSPDAGAINHNFRTLIVDTAGHLQMVYPVTGDLSDSIVDQMLKAAAVKPEMTKR